MKTKYPIYIPSKARHSKCLTADILLKEDIDFYIVAEPQDFVEYAKIYSMDRCLMMGENDRGIAYVRNWCKKDSIGKGYSYHWQIDDNIRSFKIRENNKNIKSSCLNCLLKVEDFIDKHNNIGISGLRHHIFAFSQKNDISLNHQIYSCALINNSLDVCWRDDLVEDTDYSLQVLCSDYCTVLFNRLLIEKIATMAMKGGNTEISYSGNKRLERSLGLQKAWPDIFKVTEQYGRYKVLPSRIWSKFKQELVLKK